MNRQEALAVLRRQLALYQRLRYADLKAKIGENDCCDVAGPSGTEYQVEIQVLWEKAPGQSILVTGAVDDGGLRAFVPLCEGFVRAPG